MKRDLQLESRPTAELTPADVKRLGMLQDARMFQGEYFTHVRNGKGGRERLSPIIGPNAAQIIQRIQETPGEEKVWQHVHQSADIHGYRAEYATAIYKAHARAIQDIPYDRINRGTGRRYQSQVYTCRKDEAGRNWTRRPCWYAVRAWDITGSAWWPTNVYPRADKGGYHGRVC